MQDNDLMGFGLFLGYFIVAGIIPLFLLRVCFKAPFEITRKILHMVMTLSIFPLLKLFSSWYMAALAALMFGLLIYPILVVIERTAFYKQIAVERTGGEFKKSLLIVLLSMIILITVFWGLLGIERQYIAVVAIMGWGFGDAAAALIGKTFGRRPIQHPHIAGRKTVEGTAAMFVVAALAIFFTLLLYAGQPWYISITVALLVAPVCAVVELFSPGAIDTITVPLATAGALLPLMTLISFLGI